MNEYKNILFGTVSEKWNKLVKETCVKDSELAEHLLLIHERFCVDQCSLKTRKNGQNNMPDLDPFKNDISLDMEVQDENEEDCRLRDPSRDKGDTAVHIKGEPPDAYENSYTQTSVQGNISNTTSHTCNTNGPTPAKKTLSKYSIVVDTFGKPLGVVQASEDGSKNQILPILTTIQPTDIIQIRSALEKSSSQTNPNEDSSTVKSSLPSQSNQNISRKNSTSLSSQTQKRLKEIGPVNDSESVMGTDLERSVEDEHNLGEEEPNQEEDQIEDEVEDDQEDEDNCNLQEDSEDDSYNSGEEESEDGSPQYTPPAKKRRTRLNKEDSVDDSYHSGDEESEDGSPQYSPPAKKRKTGQQKKNSDQNFVSESSLLSQIQDTVEKEHICSEKIYNCGQCGQLFNTCSEVQRHYDEVHLRLKRYQCDTCGDHFSRKWSLRKHIRRHHLNCGYRCSTCGKTFNQRGHMLDHEKIHSDTKDFYCDRCGQNYRYSRSLKRHMLQCTGEKKRRKKEKKEEESVTCNICHKTLSKRRYLIQHMAAHSEEKHQCEKCGEVFKWRQSQWRHTQKCNVSQKDTMNELSQFL